MMPVTLLVTRLRILIMARLLIASSLLFYAQFVFPAEGILFYNIIAVTAGASIVYLAWLIWAKRLNLLAYVQIGCDILLESALVYYTGAHDSVFATIYILSILGAGIVLLPAAAFFVAGVSSVCFVGTVFLHHIQWAPPGFRLPSRALEAAPDPVYLFYASYVRITVFFLVALLTYYSSEMIRKLEGQIKMQERLVLLGELISNIAHEIRNPLASISGSVQLLLKRLDSKLSDRQQQLMNAVVDESERVNRIFSGLLDYSRLPELELEQIRVDSFLDQTLMLMQHQEGFNAQVNIEPLYKGKNIRMRADPEHMKQVMMNLFTNAFQAMPEGGKLKVDCRKDRTHIIISVEDTGPGMDRKALNSIFIPFKTTKTNGTGLGLALAYKVVSQHGGKILVRSKKGKGTRFEVVLPV